MTSAIIITAIICLTIIATPAMYFGFKERARKSSKEPVFTKPEATAPSFTPATQEKKIQDSKWERLDTVFGKVTVDDIEYTTYDAGEVLIHDRNMNPVICFKVDGYGHQQRTVNYIKVSPNVDKVSGAIYYVKHNPQDGVLFTKWLDEQMYGGEYSKEALKFKDTIVEIEQFNQLLASRKIKRFADRYIAN